MELGSVNFTISFKGNEAEQHEIDFYDIAQALEGFQRSLAITTHLVLNNEVITQAPSLKNARILAKPPVSGSWEMAAEIAAVGEAIYRLGTAPKETPLGHLMYSAYDYVVSHVLGVNVDFNKSLGVQYKELQQKNVEGIPILDEARFSSVIEKCEPALKIMHRPIYASSTATQAGIRCMFNGRTKSLGITLDQETYGYIEETIKDNKLVTFSGRVSSYNTNTFKGRLYIPKEGRPIPFIIADNVRNTNIPIKIAESLSTNVRTQFQDGDVHVAAYRFLSRTGRLKGILITQIVDVFD